jgi:mannose-6-phosphate isomerase
MDPVVLESNQPPDRFYRGGPQIAAFRGEGSGGVRVPEDWVASTTTVRGHSSLGHTRLPDGSPLVDEIARNPVPWLGREHVNAFGGDTKLLVKLLDAGQRLPIHAHPDRTFASAYLGAAHGKAEAWYILTPGEVFLGLRQDIDPADLQALVNAQDIEHMLSLMHRIPVKAHQTVYVPPGVMHAIGEGILLAEVQEPEDLSILLEWRDFDIDGQTEGHLGLGFDTALGAVETRARSIEEISALVGNGTSFGSVLAAPAKEYFRLERVRVLVEQQCQPGFAVVIAISGGFHIYPEQGQTVHAPQGSTTVIPHAAGKFTLNGSGTVLIARPPEVP